MNVAYQPYAVVRDRWQGVYPWGMSCLPLLSRVLPLLLLLAVGQAQAQTADSAPAGPMAGQQPARPRVGLVLSGGGARGAAHVGVLKVLEQLHVPVDAIAGTSMGAVVGGLYASGMSATQIESVIAGLDWQEAFRDRPLRRELSLRRKVEEQQYLVQLPLGLRNGMFMLPRGLLQGQKLARLLRELTLPVAAAPDFDHLPTRFRAVATDLETGQPVVLDKGDLATAIRASLSAPGLFAPVEHEGRLLADGGITRNLPVDVARAMGVDVLIVVDVSSPLSTRSDLESVTRISNQMLAILIRKDTEQQLATLTDIDIALKPQLGSQSAYDFTRLDALVTQGEVAARAQLQRLSALSLQGAAFEQYQARRAGAGAATPPQIDFVRADAASLAYAQTIEGQFGDLAGQPLNGPLLSRRMSQYYGRGTLELLDYRLVQDTPQGPRGLQFSARPNAWGDTYVRFGLRLQDDFAGNSSFDGAMRLAMTGIGNLGAEWLTDLQVGSSPKLGTSLYLPLSQRERWFIAPRAQFAVSNLPQIVDEEQVGALRVHRLGYGLDAGREFGNTAELRVGVERERGSTRLRLGTGAQPREDFSSRQYFGRFTYDTLDRAAFPGRGDQLTLEWRGEIQDTGPGAASDSLRVDWRMARSWGRNTAVVWASAGSQLQPQQSSPRTWYPLGGFLNLSGLTPDAISAPHYAISRLIYYRKVGYGGEGFLNVPLYLGVSAEMGNAWQDRSDISLGGARKDGSVFFGLDTFLGPAYVAAGYDDRGRSAFYLFLGRAF